MDDADWDDTGAILRSRFFRTRHGHEGSQDSRLPEASNEVEKAIEYLSKVRGCKTPQESLRLAVRLGFYTGDDWARLFDEQPRCDDLVLDTSFLRVAETSWLEAGGVFWGSQIAPAISPIYEMSSTRSNASSSGSTSSQWTVKLSISSIDYKQLRLTGTMEAFTDAKTNIKTYFEGEIIDFNGHSLQTLTFASTLGDDANNWRKLDPFVCLSNHELVKCLVSRKFMKELNDRWLFLRIKELDFISPVPEADVGGLTIGGFYYLALRRDDGRIQGYYYDSQSQPFQELTLMPNKRLFPSYEFR
ncbi:vacuolar import and degradation protein-domain-containing protein [Tricharina praecox]|uniref:vacuolar import and degradation protein-domain-containing protein n=1 Tax=Tricharina praecox TaxID=43433 RepID=UPI00221F6AF2|nr:vacuolar import and degradation protein-domain-containing protein [Tricharina praecox]KAI5853356.1 vacuolar import and degradation protein-domain-containing protein [Tricharina praecox]